MAYIGSSAAVTPVAFSGVNAQSFNGDGSTVAFTLNRPVSSVAAIEVVVNNVQQSPYDGSYSVNDTTLTFSAAPSTGTGNIYVVYRDFPVGSITDPNTYTKTQTDTLLAGRVAKTGDTMTGALVLDTAYQNGLRILRDYDVTGSPAGQGIQFGAKLGGTPVYPVEIIGVTDTDGSAYRLEVKMDNTYPFTIDSAGRVAMPYQPGFKASGLSAQNTDTTGATDYKFNNTSAARGYNTGNHYSTTTGRFTAPVNGVYLFSVNVMGDGTSDRFMIRLKINGSDVHQGSSSSQANQYQDSKITATLNLAAGDYVSVGCWGAKLNYGGNGALEMWFCGHLIG